MGCLLLLAAALTAVCVTQGRTIHQLEAALEQQAQMLPVQEPQPAQEPVTVEFTSRCLEAAVRGELNQPTGPVLREDLKRVERLALVGTQVIGREQSFFYMGCANLDGEMLPTEDQGDVRELSLLSEMPNLKELILCNQPLTDLSPLEGLGLETVILGGCQVEDISALGTLSSLRELLLDSGSEAMLHLEGTDQLTAPSLTKLSLYQVQVEDWSFLEGLEQVWSLSLRNPPSQALEALAGMERLGELDITGYPEEDLKALKLPGLDTLTIRLSAMSLEGAQQLTGLGTLSLVRCTAQELTPLENLPRLISINLDGPELDYTQLSSLRALQYVRVPAEYREKVEEACPGHTFRLVD